MNMVVLKSAGEIELMHQANAIVHEVLRALEPLVVPGVTTRELDRCAEELIRRRGAAPAFLHYRGYPATLCTSINDVVIHGIPGGQELRQGDIIGVDCGVQYRGYFGDAARTYRVGQVSADADRLLSVTSTALERAVEQVRPGARVSDIGFAVQSLVEGEGFSVVRAFNGHGIGIALHELPEIPNYGAPGHGARLKPGMVLAIEPMVNAGAPDVRIDADGWTARTEDGSWSAHFEYSVAVTETGARVLGVSPA